MFSQSGKYSRTALMKVLGIKGSKLPAHGTPDIPLGDGFRVYLQEQGPELEPVQHWGTVRARRRMKHRIMIVCTCGLHIPSGRMGQHLRSGFHTRHGA